MNSKLHTKFRMGTRLATVAAVLMLSIILSVVSALAAPLAQTTQVTVTVQNTDSVAQPGLPVYAFNGTTYTNLNGTTDANGQVIFDLPDGNYNFRADLNNTRFFSGGASGLDTCTVDSANLNCTTDSVTVTEPVVVKVEDTNRNPLAGVPVYAFNGTTYANKTATTDASGQASLTLLPGDYNFRADVNGSRYFSGGASGVDTCQVTDPNQICTSDTVTVPVFTDVTVTVADTYSAPQPGLPVYVFSGATYTNQNATTDANGQVTFTLTDGSYNFRADLNGTQFFSGGPNRPDTCTVDSATPVCTADSVTVTTPVVVTVVDSTGALLQGIPVYAFNGTTYANKTANTDASGQASLTLLQGDYNFRADVNGSRYFSGGAAGVDTCQVTDPNQICTTDTVTASVFGSVTVTVSDTVGAVQPGLPVYVFSGASYTNQNDTTDANGQVTFTLPAGDYNFRTDLNGNQYFSGGASGVDSCTTPTCTTDGITVPVFGTVTVSVIDNNSAPVVGVPVYAFTGITYTNRTSNTNASGQVTFTLPAGGYNFRADVNGNQYFSGGTSGNDTCTIPGCTTDNVSVSVFGTVVVTVVDTYGTPQAGLPVYAFTGVTYTNRTANTDASGQVTFTLPAGDYNFRVDLNGTQFFSGGPSRPDTCTTPSPCTADSVTVTTPVLVTVADTSGTPQVGVPVYAYNGATYANKTANTDASGHVTFTLLTGDYNFRADVNGNQYYSGGASGVNTCQVNDPNQICSTDAVTVPAPAVPQANLSVTKAVNNGIPASGDAIVYTISVANSGPDDATGVVVTDTLPLSVTYSSDDSGGAYNGTTWAIGSLISGTTATLNITATVNTAPDGTVITNTVDVSGSEADPNPTNNAANVTFTVTNPVATTLVTVTVTSANGTAVPNQPVTVYTLDTTTGITTATTISDTTNISGTVNFNLPAGDYVFIADDSNGERYSSAACAVPTCTSIDLFLFSKIDVTVVDTNGADVANQVVYVFDDLNVYQNISGTTNISGTISFNLDSGNYMFYAYDANGVGYNSVPVPCTAPGCTAATITMPIFGMVDVTVSDGLNTIPGKPVQVYTVDATTGATGTTTISDTTNLSGTVKFTLAAGSYQFAAADAAGTTFFSPTCDVPACITASLIVGGLDVVTVTVKDTTGAVVPNQIVYGLDSSGAEIISDTTGISGTVNFSLPAGDYTFAADAATGTRYFSAVCTLPGCTAALITLPASAVTLPAATCTESGGVRTCDLWATSGTLTLPDGSSITIWGYTDTDPANGGTAQLPGPMIIANEGETINVNLHNDLPNGQTSSLLFKGLNMVPDLNGIASGGSKTYSFSAASPGTYLYQAGLTGSGTKQVAMGLYGALIIRPVDGSGAPILSQAYGNAATSFDDETLLVLSEIDPSLNTNPTGFDLNDFKPQYWLINGQAYPQTNLIQTLAGHKVLLRYVNAGLEFHSMGVLGLTQAKHGLDGDPLPGAHKVTAETLAPGQTLDSIVTVPSGAMPDSRFALHDTDLLLHNAGSPGFGGMLTFVATLADNSTRDPGGPATTEVLLTPSSTASSVNVDILADVTDANNGGDNIQAVEFFVGAPGADGAGTALAAVDAFDSAVEQAQGTIPAATLSGLSSGNYTVYVHGQDDQGNWGPFHPAVLHLDKDGPASTGLKLVPNPGGGSGNVTLTGTADDRASGNSNVTAARYSVDGGATSSMSLNVNAPIAGLSAVIDVTGLSAGVHTVAVQSQDSFGHWGPAATIDLMVDQTGPDTVLVSLLPNANNGTLPVNASLFSMRVNATISDPVTIGVQSNIKAVEGFIDYQPGVDQDGTGFPLTPADGRYNSPSEDAYAFIPLSTINALAEGVHTIGIHGQDASGNWGAVVNAQLTIDKTPPTVSGLIATPNPTNGAATTDIAATATDATTSIAMAEWFVGADPGAGNGTPMAVAFNGTDWDITSVIDVAGWADGDYTLSVRARDAAGNWSAPISITLSVSDAPTPPADQLYFSTVGGGNSNAIPNLTNPFDDADIYRWDGAIGGNAFTRFFDGTANGLPGNADIDALAIENDFYYVSFNRNNGTNVRGIGIVQDNDIVYYKVEDDEWAVLLTGQDNCLGAADVNGYDIDALDVMGGVVYFSIAGNNPIDGVPGPYDDADIYAWNGGDTCERVFDARGGAGGNLLPGYADVDGLTVVDGNTFYMSFKAATTNITGLGAVQDEDVVLYDKGVWTLFFDGTAHNLDASNGQDLDAIDVK